MRFFGCLKHFRGTLPLLHIASITRSETHCLKKMSQTTKLFDIVEMELCRFSEVKNKREWYEKMIGKVGYKQLSRELYSLVRAEELSTERIADLTEKITLEEETIQICEENYGAYDDHSVQRSLLGEFSCVQLDRLQNARYCMEESKQQIESDLTCVFRNGGKRLKGGRDEEERMLLQEYLNQVFDEYGINNEGQTDEESI